MIMPVTVLALAQLPLFMRYARSSMLEAMSADYVVTARAKGLRGITGFGPACVPQCAHSVDHHYRS